MSNIYQTIIFFFFFGFTLFLQFLTHGLTVDIFVISIKSASSNIDWLANFWQLITLIGSFEFGSLKSYYHLAIINHDKAICSASGKENVVATTAADLKHLVYVSTLEIMWCTLLDPSLFISKFE